MSRPRKSTTITKRLKNPMAVSKYVNAGVVGISTGSSVAMTGRDFPVLPRLNVHEQLTAKKTTERRYFISSHSGKQAQKIATLIRNHWRVENELHWTLDVSFNEDQCRVRIENAAENLCRIRRISLVLLKNDTTCKLGIKSKRAKAGYDRNYLLTLLGFDTTNQNKSP